MEQPSNLEALRHSSSKAGGPSTGAAIQTKRAWQPAPYSHMLFYRPWKMGRRFSASALRPSIKSCDLKGDTYSSLILSRGDPGELGGLVQHDLLPPAYLRGFRRWLLGRSRSLDISPTGPCCSYRRTSRRTWQLVSPNRVAIDRTARSVIYRTSTFIFDAREQDDERSRARDARGRASRDR